MKLFTSVRRRGASGATGKQGARRRSKPTATTPGEPLSEIFLRLRLQPHVEAFQSEGILDSEDLKLVREKDMKELGITKIGERNRLKAWIDEKNSIRRSGSNSSQAESATGDELAVDVKSCRRFFDCIDTEMRGRGELDAELLGNAFKYVGCYESEAATRESLQNADIDNSGSLNFSEFVHLLKTSTKGTEIVGFSDKLVQCLDEISWATTNEEDLLCMQITENAKKKTNRLASHSCLPDVPEAHDCADVECNAAFDFVRSNPELITSLISSGCKNAMEKMMVDSKGDEALVRTVVSNATQLFFRILHKQVHTFGLASLRGMAKSGTLDIFRMAAIFEACNRSVGAVSGCRQ